MTQEATQILDLTIPAAASPQILGQTVPAPAMQAPHGSQLGPESSGAMMSGINTPAANDGGRRRTLWLVLGGVFAVLGALFVVSEDAGIDSLMALIGLGAVEELPPPPAPARRKERKDKVADPVTSVVAAQKPKATADGSIWETLGNEMAMPAAKPSRVLTPDEMAGLEARAKSEFSYQKYLLVQELAALNASGGEELLRESLKSPKLWTRMRAVMALADFGEELSVEEFKMAWGNARTDQVIGFFKRFERSEPCSSGCYYVARAMMPYVSPRARASLISLIKRESSDLARHYVEAAANDVDESVRKAASQ
jgi:hypothetical protein